MSTDPNWSAYSHSSLAHMLEDREAQLIDCERRIAELEVHVVESNDRSFRATEAHVVTMKRAMTAEEHIRAMLSALKECRNAIQGGVVSTVYKDTVYHQQFGQAFLDYINSNIDRVEG